MPEVQDVFQRFGSDYLKNHLLSPVQAKAFCAICNCRTAVLGAHLDTCDRGYCYRTALDKTGKKAMILLSHKGITEETSRLEKR